MVMLCVSAGTQNFCSSYSRIGDWNDFVQHEGRSTTVHILEEFGQPARSQHQSIVTALHGLKLQTRLGNIVLM